MKKQVQTSVKSLELEVTNLKGENTKLLKLNEEYSLMNKKDK